MLQINKSVDRKIDFRGYEPITTKPVVYDDGGGFYISIIEAAELGDTLVKKSNETWFILKKKRVNLKFNVHCSGDEYLENRADMLKKEPFKWVGS